MGQCARVRSVELGAPASASVYQRENCFILFIQICARRCCRRWRWWRWWWWYAAMPSDQTREQHGTRVYTLARDTFFFGQLTQLTHWRTGLCSFLLLELVRCFRGISCSSSSSSASASSSQLVRCNCRIHYSVMYGMLVALLFTRCDYVIMLCFWCTCTAHTHIAACTQ